MSLDPKAINDPARATLAEADLEGVGRALLTLTQELYVLSDRVFVLEQVLAERGIDVADAIEAWQPDEAAQQQLNDRGAQLLSRVMDALQGGTGAA